MSDTPPPELVDCLVAADRSSDEVSALRHLAALAEWATAADGTVGLIDPTTWTVLDAEDVGQATVQTVSDVPNVEPLWLLSPRGGEL